MIAVVHVAFKECFFLEKVWDDKKKKKTVVFKERKPVIVTLGY